jgi:dTDP-4-amino-4,6-dideoxygalactose transaminase
MPSLSTGEHRTLLTTSRTQALEMAALLLDLQPGDEAIVPLTT